MQFDELEKGRADLFKKACNAVSARKNFTPLALSSMLMLGVLLWQLGGAALHRFGIHDFVIWGAESQAVPSSSGTAKKILGSLTALNESGSVRPAPTLVPLLDEPRPNGPPPVVIHTATGVYRAVHYISKWSGVIHGWLPISPDLTDVNKPGSPGYGVDGITAVSTLQNNWYVGTLTGTVEVKTPHQPWEIRDHGLPERTVSAIAIDPSDPYAKLAVVGFAGYSSSTPATPGHVFVTLDGGLHWLDISGDLPDAPVTKIRFTKTQGHSPSGAWLQVEVAGTWYNMAGQGHWQRVKNS